MTAIAFDRFDSIKNPRLRAYNRMVMMHNLKEDFGEAVLKQYLEPFNQADRKLIMAFIGITQKFGAKRAKELATENMEFSDE